MKKEGYFKKNYNLFINSFKKIDLKIFHIVFFDLLFYSLVPLIAIATYKVIENRASLTNMPADLLQVGAETAENLLSDLKVFFFLLIAMLILMVITIIIDWSIFKGLAWGLTIKRKFNFKFFLKFFILNLIWLGTYAILIFLFALTFRESALWIYLLILTLIWTYFTNIIYTLFMKNEKKAVRKAFKLGFTKIHLFILPYLILFIILSIIFFIMNLTTALPYGIGLTIIILTLLFYLAWARFYIVELIESF